MNKHNLFAWLKDVEVLRPQRNPGTGVAHGPLNTIRPNVSPPAITSSHRFQTLPRPNLSSTCAPLPTPLPRSRPGLAPKCPRKGGQVGTGRDVGHLKDWKLQVGGVEALVELKEAQQDEEGRLTFRTGRS